jgi:hypothetical protein
MNTMLQVYIFSILQKFKELYFYFIIQYSLYFHKILFYIANSKPSKILLLFIILLLIIVFLLISLIMMTYTPEKKDPNFKKLISILPVKICYWQEEGHEYFVHGDISLLLKNPLNGYSLIQFILTYNQEIVDLFDNLQNDIITHLHTIIPSLNVSIYITKHEDYFFMILNKLDQNNETLITTAINTIGNMIWIEVDDVVVYANELAKKYIHIISNCKNNPTKNLLYFDNHFYKYTYNYKSSYKIYMLTEIDEFKNFNEQEKYNELLYEYLVFLKEKFVIMTREGKIIFISSGLKELINIQNTNTIYNIGDLLEVMRSNCFLPDEINFNTYINNIKNNIFFCKNIESEYFSCLDGRLFSKTMIPQNNHVMMIFEDISKQIANNKESLQNKTLQDFYFQNTDEGVIIFDINGELQFSNTSLKNFINESNIENKESFLKHIKIIDIASNIYKNTSLNNQDNYILLQNTLDNLDIFILKSNKVQITDNHLVNFFYQIIKEIELQQRYWNYLNEKEKDVKKIEQFNFVYKSLNRSKIYTYSNIDYYEVPKILNLKTINIIKYVQEFFQKMSQIYNLNNIKTEYLVQEYNITIDLILLQRCLMYLLEFFYSFFLITNKNIVFKTVKNAVFIELYIETQFDFNDFNNTRLLFVLQKLLHFMKFEVYLRENHKSFTLFIKYTNNI